MNKKLYLIVVIVVVAVLAFWWWSSRKSGSDIDKYLQELNVNNLDSEFNQIDQGLKNL